MNRFALSLFIFFAFHASGQWAIINDPHGFVNIYRTTDSTLDIDNPKHVIIGTLHSDEVFLLDPAFTLGMDNFKWVAIRYFPHYSELNSRLKKYYGFDTTGIIMVGIIPDSSYRLLYENTCIFSQLKKEKEIQGNDIDSTLYFYNDSITLKASKTTFNPKEHTFQKKGDYKIERIDNLAVTGTSVSDSIPKKQLDLLQLSIHGKDVKIPESMYKDLFEPTLKNFEIFNDTNGKIYISMWSRENNVSYSVVWVIKNGTFFKRYTHTADGY